jgi:hypothetical protein
LAENEEVMVLKLYGLIWNRVFENASCYNYGESLDAGNTVYTSVIYVKTSPLTARIYVWLCEKIGADIWIKMAVCEITNFKAPTCLFTYVLNHALSMIMVLKDWNIYHLLMVLLNVCCVCC